MRLEDILDHVLNDTDFTRYAKKYRIPPRHAYQYPDTYWNLIIQGKKPLIHTLPDSLQEPIRDYMRNGHDPSSKGAVLILTLAASFAASRHAPPLYQDLRMLLEEQLRAYVSPTNHFS